MRSISWASRRSKRSAQGRDESGFRRGIAIDAGETQPRLGGAQLDQLVVFEIVQRAQDALAVSAEACGDVGRGRARTRCDPSSPRRRRARGTGAARR